VWRRSNSRGLDRNSFEKHLSFHENTVGIRLAANFDQRWRLTLLWNIGGVGHIFFIEFPPGWERFYQKFFKFNERWRSKQPQKLKGLETSFLWYSPWEGKIHSNNSGNTSHIKMKCGNRNCHANALFVVQKIWIKVFFNKV
jgi:hypothetical protein